MPRATKPSFITELPLKVDSKQDCELEARFQGARQLYNACLGEAMTRLNLVRNSTAYQEAKKIPRTAKKQRSEAFEVASDAYSYSEFDLIKQAAVMAKASKWIAEKVDASTCQAIAKRAFRASQRVMFGRAKKVRFRVPSQFKSVENQTKLV